MTKSRKERSIYTRNGDVSFTKFSSFRFKISVFSRVFSALKRFETFHEISASSNIILTNFFGSESSKTCWIRFHVKFCFLVNFLWLLRSWLLRNVTISQKVPGFTEYPFGGGSGFYTRLFNFTRFFSHELRIKSLNSISRKILLGLRESY